jgi:aspartate aminotransferase
MRGVFSRRRDRAVRAINAVAGLSCSTPVGAFYVFVDVRGLLGKRAGERVIATDEAFATWLIEEARVALVPGTAFGAPGYVRISYATSEEEIDRGVQRIATAVASLR